MSRQHLDDDICVHIFTTSAAMLGVCMTVVGVIRVVTAVRRVNTIADEMLSINAIVYLCAGLCAYWALRTKRGRRNLVLERVADSIALHRIIFHNKNTAHRAGELFFQRFKRMGQILTLHGLHQIAHRTERQGGLLVIACRDDMDGDVARRILALEPVQHGEAGLIGQAKVQHDGAGAKPPGEIERFFRRSRNEALETSFA